MVTRVGGLASGMDIDSIVEKLMSAEKAPLNKLYQQQTKYEWERDAYREINTALSTFDDYLFDNYRLSSNFYKKTVTSTNSNLVTATATSAASGSLTLEAVSQLASSARVVGNTINANSSTKLSELGITEGSVSINAIQSNGKLLENAVNITIDANETVDSFLKKINNSAVGVTAIYENNKISFTAKNTGNNATGGEIVVNSGANVFNKLLNSTSYTDGSSLADNGKNAVLTINGISTEKSSNSFSLNGYNITLRETFNSEQSLGQSFMAASENKTNSDTAYNNMLSFDYAGSLASKYLTGTGSTTAEALNTFFEDEADSRKASVNTAKSDLTTAQNTMILQKDQTSISAGDIYNSLSTQSKEFAKNYLTASTDFKNLSTEAKAEFDKLDTTEQDKLKALSSESIAGVANVVEKTKILESAQSSLNELNTDLNTYHNTVAAKQNNDAVYNTSKSSLKSALLSTATTQEQIDSINNATDAELLQSAQYLNEKGATVSAVTLTSSTDVDNMVDKIKKFVETYNGLVTTINGKLKETYDRKYPPLTDEQKEEMSEDEIEKWEKKAQTGLLRNDSILTNGLYSMRRTFMDAVGGLGDATINSLAEIGITTSSTTSDGGKLVIDEDKLRTAIEKNADQVASIFTKTGTAKDASKGITEDTRGIAQRLRDELKSFTGEIEKKAGKASATNQTYTIGKRLDEVKTRIDAWVDKLESIESRYWKQFTAMETAINKANSQSSIFSQA